VLFGNDILFDADRDEVVFPGGIRDARLASADLYLNQILVSYCEEALAHRATKPGTIRTQVENEIVPLLPHGKATAIDVSRKLGMSQRTLARRLGSEQLTFAKVLDNLRHDLGLRYLRDAELPISTIAWLLGYQEVSGFTHAFKRWTGRTPRQARTELT